MGVLCDRKVPLRVKDKLHKTFVKPAKMYGSERWAVNKKDEVMFEVSKIIMLNRVRKEYVYPL